MSIHVVTLLIGDATLVLNAEPGEGYLSLHLQLYDPDEGALYKGRLPMPMDQSPLELAEWAMDRGVHEACAVLPRLNTPDVEITLLATCELVDILAASISATDRLIERAANAPAMGLH